MVHNPTMSVHCRLESESYLSVRCRLEYEPYLTVIAGSSTSLTPLSLQARVRALPDCHCRLEYDPYLSVIAGLSTSLTCRSLQAQIRALLFLCCLSSAILLLPPPCYKPPRNCWENAYFQWCLSSEDLKIDISSGYSLITFEASSLVHMIKHMTTI